MTFVTKKSKARGPEGRSPWTVLTLTPGTFSISPERGVWRQRRCHSASSALCHQRGNALASPRPVSSIQVMPWIQLFPFTEIFPAWGTSTQKYREDEGKKELPELEARMGPEFY